MSVFQRDYVLRIEASCSKLSETYFAWIIYSSVTGLSECDCFGDGLCRVQWCQTERVANHTFYDVGHSRGMVRGYTVTCSIPVLNTMLQQAVLFGLEVVYTHKFMFKFKFIHTFLVRLCSTCSEEWSFRTVFDAVRQRQGKRFEM